RLRTFDREAGPDAAAEILHVAGLGNAQPVEAGDVLRVDGERDLLAAWNDAARVGGEKAPGLAGEEVAARRVVVDGAVEVAHAQQEAVAFARVRDVAGAQKVRLGVSRKMRVLVDVAGDEAGDAALPRAAAALVL